MGAARGNATEAARMAGYRSPRAEGSRLLTNADIREAVAERVRTDPLVATRHEVMRRLSSVVRGEIDGSRVSDEIRAAELLLRVQGALVDKHEHTGSLIDELFAPGGAIDRARKRVVHGAVR